MNPRIAPASLRLLYDRRGPEDIDKLCAELRRLPAETRVLPWYAQMTAFCDAHQLLAQEPPIDVARVLAVVGPLAAAFEFAVCVRLLRKAREQSLAPAANLAVCQQLAQCIYKDEEILPAVRLEDALAVLRDATGDREPDAETLRITGGIYKRRWELTGSLDDLLLAHDSYLRPWAEGLDADCYGAINAAFACDALAAADRERARRLRIEVSDAGAAFEVEAKKLRQDTVATISANADAGYWHLRNLGEAQFGLGDYSDAASTFAKASATYGPSPWQLQSATTQLAALFANQFAGRPAASAAQRDAAAGAIAALSGIDVYKKGIASTRGKVGLALSGGGFRASLYHLGVLARLAEMDVLRHVEAISTVSGGSIVGAQYYLALREMLQTKGDDELATRDYVRLVDALIPRFLDGVRANMRMRMFTNLASNLHMLVDRTMTRSRRLGQLYESHFFRGHAHGASTPMRMSGLLIVPKDAEQNGSFSPRFENWSRANKVPALLLNATSLNTGHGWLFTARSMGEPAALVGREVDSKPRYRQLWYSQAPTSALQEFPLGSAVAASAGVPGLFEPIVLAGLYDKRTVRLVDGGVHDNQGAAALLAEGCRFILCSDASGQMAEVQQPGTGELPTLLRTNSVLMDRVRSAQYEDLDARKRNRAIDGLFFIHMTKDMCPPKVDWIGCQDPAPAQPREEVLPYRIDRRVQQKLANLRTDLDAFNDTEAAALMASGYLMTRQEFEAIDDAENGGRRDWGGFHVDAPSRPWPFLEPAFLKQLEQPAGRQGEKLVRLLDAGSAIFFKALKVSPLAVLLTILFAALGFYGLVLAYSLDGLIDLFDSAIGQQVRVGGLVAAAATIMLVALMPALRWLKPESVVRRWIMLAIAGVVGWAFSWLYLAVYNPIFLHAGRLGHFYHRARARSHVGDEELSSAAD